MVLLRVAVVTLLVISQAAAAGMTIVGRTFGDVSLMEETSWPVCYGELPKGALSVIGTYLDFVVLADGSNQTLVVDLRNGTIFRNVTHSLTPSDYAFYQVLPNGVLLRLDYATLTAWSLPDLIQLWSVLTFPILKGSDVVFSSTGNFFCLWAWAEGYVPFCFRVSDGSLLWTGAANASIGFRRSSLVSNSLLESNGVLVFSAKTYFQSLLIMSAVDIKTGTYLWSESFTYTPSSQVIAAHDDTLVYSIGAQNGTQALDLRTGRLKWSRPELDPPPSPTNVLAVNGLILSNTSGAFFAGNGSSLWSFPSNASPCPGGMVLAVPSVEHHSDPKFLCYSDSFATYTFVSGDVRTGQLSTPSELTSPATLYPFGSELGFYALSSQPVTPTSSTYCLHKLSD